MDFRIWTLDIKAVSTQYGSVPKIMQINLSELYFLNLIIGTTAFIILIIYINIMLARKPTSGTYLIGDP